MDQQPPEPRRVGRNTSQAQQQPCCQPKVQQSSRCRSPTFLKPVHDSTKFLTEKDPQTCGGSPNHPTEPPAHRPWAMATNEPAPNFSSLLVANLRKMLNGKHCSVSAAPSTCSWGPTVGSHSPIPPSHMSGPQTPQGFVLPVEEQHCPASASHREKPRVGA